MVRNKKVKIVATVGPASHTPEALEELAFAGVDIFRLNLSHQHHDTLVAAIKNIRVLEKKLNKIITIMGDLGGLKVRIGNIKEGTELKNGQKIKISVPEVDGDHTIFSINYPTIIKQLREGTEILINDGLIKLVVTKPLIEDCAEAVVEVGGSLLPHKGFFAQGISLSEIGLPQKDKDDIKLMVELGVDALAVSFVQNKFDLLQVREQLTPGSEMILIAKIETKLAVDNMTEIIQAADGVMIARGDLGLAMPIAQVPILQKKLITQCLELGKPVITATQMLESMTQTPFPTRAEATDVANAILDGTDAVMLSEETAMGKYPVEAVKVMSSIIEYTAPHIKPLEFSNENQIPHSISSAVGIVTSKLGAKAIIAFTQSGFSALQIARHRYSQEIIVALTPSMATMRKLNFCWGVYSRQIKGTDSFDHALIQAKEFIQNNDLIKLEKGDPYIIVAGLPFNRAGTTNLIHVELA